MKRWASLGILLAGCAGVRERSAREEARVLQVQDAGVLATAPDAGDADGMLFYGGAESPPGECGAGAPRGLRVDCVQTNGYLPRAPVEAILAKMPFKTCERPGLVGTVDVRFVIARNGSVSMAKDVTSTIGDAAASACVVHVFWTANFDLPLGGIVSVVYRVHLGR